MAISFNIGNKKETPTPEEPTKVIGARAARKGAVEVPPGVQEWRPEPEPPAPRSPAGLSLDELRALVAERERAQESQKIDVPYVGTTENLSTDLLLACLAELQAIRRAIEAAQR